MILRPALTAAALLAATQSAALSCLPSDISRAYRDAAESADSYVILQGAFRFDAAALPPAVQSGDGVAAADAVPADFQGIAYDPAGGTRPYSGPVTLQPECAGPWCGRIEPGGEVLAFVRLEDGALTLALDPCFANVFTDPSADTVATLEACLAGEACGEAG
ncbi:hypothetical protein OG2516_12261 [Oceanicola granulosus HTCC2516]|uniref:Uncharacterized protein n=1 Tax=Oceanicola granulosus (strain ATCC BAA-861 / DSM 15982 / KCTC 12143 / HTCC2516) TaxID=314256 RepID=Q2CD56_OCEGH|nr:hypothetical protein [Oceanicola granulosus]EAR50622.1 hypothetical protein OG2516_12261 [Oceanicola granulosus HTCC2516]